MSAGCETDYKVTDITPPTKGDTKVTHTLAFHVRLFCLFIFSIAKIWTCVVMHNIMERGGGESACTPPARRDGKARNKTATSSCRSPLLARSTDHHTRSTLVHLRAIIIIVPIMLSKHRSHHSHYFLYKSQEDYTPHFFLAFSDLQQKSARASKLQQHTTQPQNGPRTSAQDSVIPD